MDSRNATVVGKEGFDGEFVIIESIVNAGPDNNSNENAANNQEKTLTQKFFKEIAAKMPNVEVLHVTGTGQIQEQFIKFLSETPQFKNVQSTESTSNKMSDESLALFMKDHFN